MDAIRACGLIFFMTILIAGCIAAVSASPPPPPPVDYSPREVTWEEALQFLYRGVVASVTQTPELRVHLLLRDGTRLVTREPEINAIFKEIESCGAVCIEHYRASAPRTSREGLQP